LGNGIIATGYGFYVKPIRSANQFLSLFYSGSTGEICYSASDDRIKVNEVSIVDATKTLLKLKPQNYDKIEDIGSSNIIGHESGLMAQDVWYDAPEMRHIVYVGEGGEPSKEKPMANSDDPRDDPDYSAWGSNVAAVNYIQIIPYLVKSIQELESRIRVLEGG